MVYTTSKNGDDLEMVYGIVLTALDTFFDGAPLRTPAFSPVDLDQIRELVNVYERMRSVVLILNV